MRERTMMLTSAGLGVATAYLLDPASGNRRRRRIGDALVHAAHETTGAISTVGRDFRNRTRGIVASARRTIRRERPSDIVLRERVRAALGRVASHPHAVQVEARNGHVILSGQIQAAEEHRLVYAVQAVAGVNDVETVRHSHAFRRCPVAARRSVALANRDAVGHAAAQLGAGHAGHRGRFRRGAHCRWSATSRLDRARARRGGIGAVRASRHQPGVPAPGRHRCRPPCHR
jgi:hypothetical protein